MIKKYGLLGKNISYTISPLLHNFWIQAYGLQAVYEKRDQVLTDPQGVLHHLGHQGFWGVNVTIPYKKALYDVVTIDDPYALQAGAVNTLAFSPSLQKWYGYNTDVQAVLDLLPPLKTAFILGNGGAALATLGGMTALGFEHIYVCGRTPHPLPFRHVTFVPWGGGWDLLSECQVVVNATPLLGLADKVAPFLAKEAIFMDWIYHYPPSFFACPPQRPAISGEALVVQQARHSFYHWFDIFPEVTHDLQQKIRAFLGN